MEALDIRDEVTEHNAAGAANSMQLIAFSIGEEIYGVEITTVREIRAWNGATPLPNTRAFVRGVINLRGTIVPIFDLRARFGDVVPDVE
jgi:purine-binding chemotaxis protein CheW